jgi:hypothetical protein
MDRRLGQILVNQKAVNERQVHLAKTLQESVNNQSQRKFRIGEIMVFQKFINLQQLHDALRAQKNSPDDIRWITQSRFKD